MKKLKKKIKKSVKRILASFLMMTTIVWSLGVPLAVFVPQKAKAAAPTAGQVVISEIKVQDGGDATKQFVELYNTTGSDLDLADCGIATAPASSSGSLSWTQSGATLDATSSRVIPAYGYFLFTPSGYEPYGIIADVNGTIGLGVDGGYVALRCNVSTTPAIIDQVGYGTVTDATLCKGGVCAPAPGTGSIERKAKVTSDAATMVWGGADEFLGNAYDSDPVASGSDSADFIQRAEFQDDPQKSTFPAEYNGFIIMGVMPIGPQQVNVMFNKSIDTATVSAAVATLSTADTTDDETITSIGVVNGNELEIYASGANIDPTTGNDTITISSAVKDTDGESNVSISAMDIKFYMPPEITGVQYVDADNIKVYFTREMDEVSTENYSAYSVYIDGSAVDINTATLTLNITGDSKILTITKIGAFNAVGGDDYVAPNYDPAVAPKDLEGNSLQPTFGWQQQFAVDGTKPYIVGGTFDSTSMTLYFSEELMAVPGGAAENPANYVFGGSTGACNGTKSVRFKENVDGPPSFDIIVITCSDGVTLNENDTVTVSTSVVDKANNPMDNTGTPAKNVFTATANANNSIKIVSVSGEPSGGSWNMMMDGCMDEFGSTGNYYDEAAGVAHGCDLNTTTNRDTLTVVFDGSINPESINYDSTNNIAYNIGSYIEVYEKHTRSASNSSDCQLWETWDSTNSVCIDKMMGSLGSSFGVLSTTTNTNDTLTIYLQGWDVNIWPGMEVNPAGIMGMNGLPAQQSDTPANNRFTMIFAKVKFVKVDKTKGADPAAYDQGDTVTIFFGGDMTRGDIPDFASISGTAAKLKPVQHMPYWNEHSWGTSGSVAWGNHNGTTCTADGTGANDGTADCLKITLGNSPTIVDGDEIMANGVTDTNGMYLGWGGVIDSTPLALNNYTWNSTFTVLTLEFNKMISDYNAGDPPVPDFSDNTIGFTDASGGGVVISSAEPVFDMTDGPMDMFKKIKISFSGVVEVGDVIDFNPGSEIGDENGNVAPDITVVASGSEDLSAGNIELILDTQGPTLARVITNDWNTDGVLNGGDEIIFIFDNEAVPSKPYVCDVDYSTLSDINAEFVVKRDGNDVSNAFGDWVGYWVDMWEEHAGELHINLGPGADIQPGDEIWATGAALADYAGNKLSTSTALATMKETRAVEITRVVYSDADTSGTLTNGDTFTVYFSEAIDPGTLGSYTAGATPEVTNIDWGLGVEFNWEAGYGSTYDASAIKTWGNATGDWNSTFKQLTITLSCTNSPCDASTTAGDASISDSDMVVPYGVQTTDGAWVNKPGFIDLVRPTLNEVILLYDGNSDGNVDPGDKIALIFSEEMDASTITAANFTISSGTLGTSPTIICPAPGICKITLDSDATTIPSTATFDPKDVVTDLAGLADNTVSPVSIQVITASPVSSVAMTDSDTQYPGIDGRDITISWTAPSDYISKSYTYLLYVVPDFIPFNPISLSEVSTSNKNEYQFPIAELTEAQANCDADDSCTWTGAETLMTDSRTLINTSTGIPANSIDYADVQGVNNLIFPLNDWDMYKAFVVTVNNDDGSQSFLTPSPSPIHLTMEYGGAMDDMNPWVEGVMPFDGAIVPINTTKMSVKFSEPMERSSVEAVGNIKIQSCSQDCWQETNWQDVAQVYVSYDSERNKAEINLGGNLAPNTKHRIYIPATGVADLSGLTLTGDFISSFRTSSESDNTPPKVIGNSFVFEGIGTVSTGGNIIDVPRTEPMIGIAFDKDMDSSTFTTTSVKLTPEVPGSSFYYEPMMRGIGYFFGSPLARNTTYTLTLSGVYIKDIAGNTLDGDSNGTASGDTSDNFTLTFTTKDEAIDTTTKPTIRWVFSDTHHIDVGFDTDMRKSAVENKANWVLAQGGQGGSIVSLQGAELHYDPFMNELHVGPIELTAGIEYWLTPSESILGMNGASIDTNPNCDSVQGETHSCLNFVPESWDQNDIFKEGGMFHEDTMGQYDLMMGTGGAFDPAMAGKMFMDNAYMDKDVKTFMPIDAWPMNQIEGKVTNYHISFPVTKAIPHGGKIVLQFPAGFDLKNAAMAKDEFMPGTPLFFFNQDINGPGGTMDENSQFKSTGKVQISNVAVNNMDKTITLTVAVEDSAGCTLGADGSFAVTCMDTSVAGTNSTMPFDYIDFELSGIKNGPASEVDWRTDTGGYQISITIKDNNNKILEGGTQKPIKSMRFPIKAAGAGSISGKVTAQDGTTPVANAVVFIDSPMSGPISTKTGTDGTYSVSGLPVASSGGSYEGWYHIHVEAPKNDDTYLGGGDFDVQLTKDSPTASGKNVRLMSADNTLTVKVTTGGITGDVIVDVWGPSGYNNKKFALDSTDDDATVEGIQNHLDIKVADGEWDVGIHPFFPETMFTVGPPPPPPFLSPESKHVSVSGNTSVSISLASAIASYEINGVVKEASTEKGLNNVHIHAFSPLGGGFHTDTETRSDGSFTLKVPSGVYQVEAFKPGLPPVPSVTVEVKDASVSGIEIIVYKPARTISGKVTDGTNGIPYVGVSAWDDEGRFAFAETDESGDYILFVDPSNSWDVEVFAPRFGKLNPDTGVTATNLDTTSSDVSGVNFTASASNIVTISGMVKDANGNAISDVEIWADEVSWSGGTEGYMTGNGNFTKTDSNGSYTLKVIASTSGTGVDATRYRISGWHPDYGDLTPISGVDASSSVSGKNFTLSTARTITIDIQNAPSDNLLNPDHADYIGEAFIDIHSQSAGKGNGKAITDSDLSDASDGSVKVPESSGYRAYLHIPGYGEFAATENGTSGFSISGSNKTIHFDLKRGGTAITPITISGTVKNESGAAIENAYVSVINETTFETIGAMTDASGNYSIKVPNLNPDGSSASYKIKVDKPVEGKEAGYTSPPALEGVAADKLDANFTMTRSTSTISGIVYNSSGIPVPEAIVMAKEASGEGFVKTTSDSNGVFTLKVSSERVWNIIAKSKKGYKGQKMNVSSGSSGIEIVLANQIKVAQEGKLATSSKTAPVTPSEGGVINDVDNTGVKLTIPSEALGTSNTPTQLSINEMAAVPETKEYKPLGGIGKEITSAENVQKSIDIEFTFKKDKIEAMTETDASSNNLSQLDQLKNVYWDDTANNYVPLSTVKTVETKKGSDVWTPTDWDTFLDNVDNSDGDGSYDYYDDYKITLKSKTDHFTIFGVITGSDSTPPSAPTGLTQTAGNGTSVTLDWNNNSESDLMEYEIYRSTSSGVTAIDTNQVNSSQITVSNFTDSTTTAWTSYYYTVTAVDSSGNESATATEIQVCSTTSVSNGTVASDCSVICDSGYTLTSDGHSCVASSVSSGGGGSEFVGSIIINNNTSQTASRSVTLQLSASGATHMAISNSSDFAGISWEDYVASKSWTLPEGDGLKTVYAKFKNSSGVVSQVASDSIMLDTSGEVSTQETVDTSGADVNPGSYYNGALIRAVNDYKVYVIKDDFKRWILSADIFSFYGHLSFAVVKEVSSDIVNSYKDASLIRVDGDPKVYEVNGDGTKHWLNMTAEQFAVSGRDWNMVYIVNQKEADYYKTGPDVLFVQ
jgi:hypothetical protein